jgi:hypothetical protein
VTTVLAAVALLVGPGASVSSAQTERVFFGNLHSHTSYSDGSGKPSEAYKYARDKGHLDFLAITEHNHADCERGAKERADGVMIATDPALYKGPSSSSLISAAKKATEDGKFVAIYGQEFSSISKGNHLNVFEVGDVITAPNGEFDELVRTWLPAHLDSIGQMAILQFNHPKDCTHECEGLGYGEDDFGTQAAWIREMDQFARLIEVENGPALKDVKGARGTRMEAGYLKYLALGFHLAPTADQDNHYETWGTSTDARTAVITDALTKRKILEALRARHVYATEDKNLHLVFHVNSHLVGDRVAPPAVGSELTIDYLIADDDEPTADYEIEPFIGKIGSGEAQPVNPIQTLGTGLAGPAKTITGIKYEGGPQYVFFKIIQMDEDGKPDFAWTAPVWFDGGGGPAPVAPVNASNFVASRNSTVYHVSPNCRDAKRINPENRVTDEQAKLGRRQHEGCPRP